MLAMWKTSWLKSRTSTLLSRPGRISQALSLRPRDSTTKSRNKTTRDLAFCRNPNSLIPSPKAWGGSSTMSTVRMAPCSELWRTKIAKWGANRRCLALPLKSTSRKKKIRANSTRKFLARLISRGETINPPATVSGISSSRWIAK